MTTERTTGYNTRFASCGVSCLHSSSIFQLGFCGGLTVLCSENPHERKAWERYSQWYRNIILKDFFCSFFGELKIYI